MCSEPCCASVIEPPPPLERTHINTHALFPPEQIDPRGAEAYERLRASLQDVAASINARNADTSLANRGPGPGVGDGTGPLPYNMLLPNSEPGITSRGVPTSVSI